MTDTDQMVTWLRAAMDAAQHDAEAATPGPWSVRPEPDAGENWEIATTGREQRWVIGAEGGGGVYDKPDADHIARHDPAAVLRRIAADRQILAEHASDGDPKYPQCVRCADTHPGDCECGWHSLGGDHWRTAQTHPCATVRALAEGYGWTEETT